MIKSLLIKNYALIRHLEMSPAPGFNTITGETGAGKSIMLGALGLLLGQRADTRVLFANNEKCIIEGIFDISRLHLEKVFEEKELDYEPESIIRREISVSGRSRAFINDTPVTLEVMKAIGDHLVDIHSQRDTLLLGSPAYQLNIIDSYARNTALVETYNEAYAVFQARKKAYDQLCAQADAMKKEADYNHFLFEELKQAGFQPGEQETLENELQIASHAEEISRRISESLNLLDNSDFSVSRHLLDIKKNLEYISGLAPHFKPLYDRLESTYLEIMDIISELETNLQDVEFDSGKVDEIQTRLDLLYRLEQKHGVQTIEELEKITHTLGEKVNRVLNLDDELLGMKAAMEKAEKHLKKAGKKLSESRDKALRSLKSRLEDLLKNLGMPKAVIKFRHEITEPGITGMDAIQILFSANAGIAPAELRNVASGGEFSRLMFAIKYILAGKMALPTIVFDEIDSGISGAIAVQLVEMISRMAATHQVIVITHLPQIAARGQTHYYVYKENKNARTVSKIKKLSGEEREREIATMIGGHNPSKIALQNARELLSAGIGSGPE